MGEAHSIVFSFFGSFFLLSLIFFSSDPPFFIAFQLISYDRREAEPGAAEVQPVRNTAGYLSIIFLPAASFGSLSF